ncbi:hypothetical protein C0J52_17637 [Blattella germanica]|nr:hypothetical protein C0J52_17637 [Blattella germanica]
MEMAQLIRLSLALLCCSAVVLSTETGENNYNDVVQFVLNWYNENSNSQHVYNSAKLLNAYKKNDSVPLYLLQLEVATSCNRSQNCQSSSLICEVGVRENLQTHTKEVLTDRAKCAKKEIEPVIPSFGHGFSEENITDEIRSIAAFAIQQSQNNGANKRRGLKTNVVLFLCCQVVGNATTLYLTLKVTKNEGGDAVQFELCEAEVNQTGEMAWESSLSCFPLNGLSSETPINAEDITTVAERAADEMDSLSYSEFTLKLKDVLKAETTIPNINPDVMMNDGMEPENEEVLIPAVEHHSIPVVEELDPIIEQILPDIEKPVASDIEEPLIPVVEEPIVAKHIYCTGCPIDLDVNNPALDEFVEQALASIDESSNGQNMYRATRITKAQKQVCIIPYLVTYY